MQTHATSMHCGSDLAADGVSTHSSGHKNFASRRSLENLYGSGLVSLTESGSVNKKALQEFVVC